MSSKYIGNILTAAQMKRLCLELRSLLKRFVGVYRAQILSPDS